MTPTQIIQSLGFTSTKDFQTAWNLGNPLTVDGIIGPLTTHAANESWSRHVGGQADLSTHYSAHEFKCPHCGVVKTHRQVLRSLEGSYATIPHTIVSGYRCPIHNAAVGGAKDSMHLYGLAVDIPGTVQHAHVMALQLWAGIGYSPSTGAAVHLDRRDLHSGSIGTLTHPNVFPDGN